MLIASEGTYIRVKWQSFELISRLAELHHDRRGVFRLYVHRFRASSRFVPVNNRQGPAARDLPHSRVGNVIIPRFD